MERYDEDKCLDLFSLGTNILYKDGKIPDFWEVRQS